MRRRPKSDSRRAVTRVFAEQGGRDGDEDRGQHGIAEGFVGTRVVGHFPTQGEDDAIGELIEGAKGFGVRGLVRALWSRRLVSGGGPAAGNGRWQVPASHGRQVGASAERRQVCAVQSSGCAERWGCCSLRRGAARR